VQCHDHERQARHWRQEEPALLRGKAHVNALKQLDDRRSASFARAVGLADPYALNGSCVRCHATVYRGDANAGVSCESCHGAAGSYLEPHQVKGSYARAVALGLRDLRGKPAAIARVCVDCHVVADPRLLAAGHPSGASFDAGAGLAKLVHWTARYDGPAVSAAARALAAPRLARAASAPTPSPLPAGGTPAGAPWDWDKVTPLPADYVPEGSPSLAEERPRLTEPAVVRASPPAEAGPASAPAPTRPPAAEVARRRGQAALVLERLLRSGARPAGLSAPARPAEFAGPDGELLRLQDEVLFLALETLRKPR
jgi:hypothetical protein